MTDSDARTLAVVVLACDEETNLPDCLASLDPLEATTYVVDSGSRDRTVEIARAAGAVVVEHPFEGYAAQRNWSFDALGVETAWTLCIDADERVTPELASEIRAIVDAPAAAFDGYLVRRRTVFMGRWLRYGGQYPAWHLRLFRTGHGRCEARLYDQHFVVEGRVGRLGGDLVDVIAADLSSWTIRHDRWASLEAAQILAETSGETSHDPGPRVAPRALGNPIERRRFLRYGLYYRMPPMLRPFLLWLWVYVARLGFLDGVPGLVFHTLHKLWFRFLVDAKLIEMRHARRGGRDGR